MKYYAIFSALRFFFMFVTLIVLLVFKMQVIYLSVLFTFPEIILLICFFIYFLKQIKIILSSRTKKLALIHLKYGTKVAWGHIVLGTKPDILIIGYFLSDTIVGIYSFASTIIDGIVQIMYVFRTNINPVITNLYYNYEKKFIENQLKKHIISHYKFFSFIGVFAAIFYPIVLYFLGVNEHLFYYFIVFYILLTGCIIASGFIPLQMIFNQTGYPSTQSIYLLTLFSMNVGLTIVFTFFCGLIGAAVSTSIIFVLQIFLLKWMVRKKLGLTIKII